MTGTGWRGGRGSLGDGDALGRGIRNFKRATTGGDEIEVTPKRPPEVTGATAQPGSAAPAGEEPRQKA